MTITSNKSESLIQKEPRADSITIEDGGNLDHVLIGSCGSIDVHVKKDALYSPLLLSDKTIQQSLNLTIFLEEPGAEVDLKGLLIGNNEQKINHQVSIHHLGEHTHSQQYCKTMASDQASIHADSTIIITENASHSKADQLTKNLLLSPKAEIKTEPKLMIDNDDVKASHGTSIGALDQQALFYLQSRGIDKDAAQSMLQTAFINEIVEFINDDDLKKSVWAQHAAPQK